MRAEASRPRQVKVTRAMGAAMRRIQRGQRTESVRPRLHRPLPLRLRGAGTGTRRHDGGRSCSRSSPWPRWWCCRSPDGPSTGAARAGRCSPPLVTAASGRWAWGSASNATAVLLSAAALGAGQAVMQPALATMIVWCSTADTRSRAFATQFFLQNLGLGMGGLIGGHIVDTTRAGSFTAAVRDRGGDVPGAGVVIGDRAGAARAADRGRTRRRPRAAAGSGCWATGPWCSCACSGFVLFFACYGQFESGLSAYGVEAAGISTSDARYGDGGEHGDDRGGAVRGAEVRRAPEAVAG